ncbi:MAG: ACP S-malonyltransferase [bacterium]|nr:ACP S-malonyltransferase [bacterium]
MKKIAFVFPGQGSQYVGMGEDIYKKYEIVRETFDKAQEALGYNLSYICFNGPKGKLDETIYTQVAILIVSISFLKVIKEENKQLIPEVVAGHSLGEYTALFAAEALNEQSVLEIVNLRAKYMQEEANKYAGGMVAILGKSREDVELICEKARSKCSKKGEILQIANLNCPLQVIISGTKEVLALAMTLAKDEGAKRVVPLTVSGPFHSLAMNRSADKINYILETVDIKTPRVPIVANFTAEYVQDIKLIKKYLVEQIRNPVLWEDSIRNMIKKGINVFVEIGPGKVISGLINRIDKSVKTININDLNSLQKFIEQ